MLSGCAPAPAPPIVTRADLEAAAGASRKSASSGSLSNDSSSGGSLNAALSQIDAATVQAWLGRLSAPLSGSKAAAPSEVRIDAEVLARRHPAWQLADALERGTVSPVAPRVTAVLNGLASPSFLTPPAALRPTLPLRPATTLRAESSRGAALRSQNAALRRFFASAAARDALRGRDEAFLSQRTLENSIAAARRGAVAELDLSVIPPDVALELTNLRLKLLRNLAKTPAQRAAAREELQAIEARYAEIWRQQTALQAEKVRQLTLEAPARAAREGLARIARENQLATRERAAARRVEERALAARLARDLARSGAALTLRLPAAPAIPSVPALKSGPPVPGAQVFETLRAQGASAGALEAKPVASARRPDAALVAGLRRLARDDARDWAQVVAARWNSRWNSRWSQKPGVPNRTGAAVAELFSSRKNGLE